MPSWVEPVWRYILTEGLPATLLISAIAVVGSALIGIVLGTLLTIEWRPSRLLIRFYIEVFRGLPILVTVFIVYFGLPSVDPALEFGAIAATSIALTLWGSAQAAGLPPPAASGRQPARQHHPELDARRRHRRDRAPPGGEVPVRAADLLPAGRHRRDPRGGDLRRRDGDLLPDLLPADAARRVPREAARLARVAPRRLRRRRGRTAPCGTAADGRPRRAAWRRRQRGHAGTGRPSRAARASGAGRWR